MAGYMHGRGVCGRGHVLQGDMHGRGHAWHARPQILRDMVNERAVRILLECILVTNVFTIFMPD